MSAVSVSAVEKAVEGITPVFSLAELFLIAAAVAVACFLYNSCAGKSLGSGCNKKF